MQTNLLAVISLSASFSGWTMFDSQRRVVLETCEIFQINEPNSDNHEPFIHENLLYYLCYTLA